MASFDTAAIRPGAFDGAETPGAGLTLNIAALGDGRTPESSPLVSVRYAGQMFLRFANSIIKRSAQLRQEFLQSQVNVYGRFPFLKFFGQAPGLPPGLLGPKQIRLF